MKNGKPSFSKDIFQAKRRIFQKKRNNWKKNIFSSEHSFLKNSVCNFRKNTLKIYWKKEKKKNLLKNKEEKKEGNWKDGGTRYLNQYYFLILLKLFLIVGRSFLLYNLIKIYKKISKQKKSARCS